VSEITSNGVTCAENSGNSPKLETLPGATHFSTAAPRRWRSPAVLALLAASALFSVACKNECQKLCDRMADVFDSCGVPFSDDELVQCRRAYEDITSQQDEQCKLQTDEVILTNLRLKSGTDNACDAVAEYAR